jgi:type I restriction enzyme S subunit
VIEDLKPYPEYKDSGLPWLGEVPVHWEIARSKRLFRQRKEFANPEDQQLSATQAYGVIPQALYEKRTGYRVVKISMHLDKRKHVEADDFVISMRSFQGGLERAWAAGAIRSSYVVLEPSAEASAGYFRHLFKSHQYINALRATSDFIRDGQDLNFGNFCGVALPLIPLQEQAAIARFLTWATNRLDRAIGAKRRIIALLQEQKQAIIHRAVTRGLDPAVPLKDSGIPWLGEIPEHWEVRRFGHAVRLQTGYPFTSTGFIQAQSCTRLLRGVNVTPSQIRWDEVVRWQRHVGEGLDDYALQVGDVVLGMDRPIIGAGVRTALIRKDDTLSLLLQRVARLRSTEILDTEFMLLLLRGRIFHEYTAPIFTGISVPHLSPQQIKNFRVALPLIEEQRNIVAELMEQTYELGNAIASNEQKITLLREYRTRLIADVVTGKLDVRELAKGLPEEVPLFGQMQDDTGADIEQYSEEEAPEEIA